MAPQKMRRTRIVCISDTHNCTVSLPPGDVLIHAGDLTNQGSYSELSKTVKWLEAADYEAKIIVAGNHDVTLDADFYFHHGKFFHNQCEQDAADCLALLTSSPSITYLCHDSATIRLKSPTGPRTQFTVFGSPYSPRHGLWAFYYDAPKSAESGEDAELTALWELIPLETDIVVTHTPPRTHRDKASGGEQQQQQQQGGGCEALRQALWRVRPRLAVCGHIHGGRGAERVLWDLENQRTPFAESSVVEWQDPSQGNNKQSKVDLTGKTDLALRNDGSHPGRFGSRSDANGENNGQVNDNDEDEDDGQLAAHTTLDATTTTTTSSSDTSRHGHACHELGGTIGYGTNPASAAAAGGGGGGARGQVINGGGGGGDIEALRGRMGRKETCIVNAAIMRKSYPHTGGKEFNKPIVVDIDLPVWEEDE